MKKEFANEEKVGINNNARIKQREKRSNFCCVNIWTVSTETSLKLHIRSVSCWCPALGLLFLQAIPAPVRCGSNWHKKCIKASFFCHNIAAKFSAQCFSPYLSLGEQSWRCVCPGELWLLCRSLSWALLWSLSHVTEPGQERLQIYMDLMDLNNFLFFTSPALPRVMVTSC